MNGQWPRGTWFQRRRKEVKLQEAREAEMSWTDRPKPQAIGGSVDYRIALRLDPEEQWLTEQYYLHQDEECSELCPWCSEAEQQRKEQEKWEK